MSLKIGDRVSRDFVIDEAAMKWFQQVSEDRSRVHCDDGFAKECGFEGVIAYGGIMLAHLSNLLGMSIPGEDGISLSWSINYHKPLYVGEAAQIVLEVVNISMATGVVEGKFRIAAGGKKVASGTTQSMVPRERLEGVK